MSLEVCLQSPPERTQVGNIYTRPGSGTVNMAKSQSPDSLPCLHFLHTSHGCMPKTSTPPLPPFFNSQILLLPIFSLSPRTMAIHLNILEWKFFEVAENIYGGKWICLCLQFTKEDLHLAVLSTYTYLAIGLVTWRACPHAPQRSLGNVCTWNMLC